MYPKRASLRESLDADAASAILLDAMSRKSRESDPEKTQVEPAPGSKLRYDLESAWPSGRDSAVQEQAGTYESEQDAAHLIRSMVSAIDANLDRASAVLRRLESKLTSGHEH